MECFGIRFLIVFDNQPFLGPLEIDTENLWKVFEVLRLFDDFLLDEM